VSNTSATHPVTANVFFASFFISTPPNGLVCSLASTSLFSNKDAIGAVVSTPGYIETFSQYGVVETGVGPNPLGVGDPSGFSP
jgi:hypothetical protein